MNRDNDEIRAEEQGHSSNSLLERIGTDGVNRDSDEIRHFSIN